MKYLFREESLGSFACDVVVYGAWLQEKLTFSADFLEAGTNQAIEQELKRRGFSGKDGEVQMLPLLDHPKIKHVLVLGLGDKKKFRDAVLRSVGARTVKQANVIKAKHVYFHPMFVAAMKDAVTGMHALVEGIELANYQFTVFRKLTAKEEAKKRSLAEVWLPLQDAKVQKQVEQGIELGHVFADATCFARDMVNTPSMHMHPGVMVECARQICGGGTGVTCKVRGKEEMLKLGMEASLAVGMGSMHEPQFVHLVYKPKKATKNTKKIALIGKAVTFDSGGLNLKPSDGITDMKIDMAGAATVLGVFHALAKIQPSVEVHGLFIAVENMPSGSSYRPGDVVAAMDGTTIEVENTDAEGRITLADALAYTSLKIKPDRMIDLATLTGAVIVALGSDISGMLGTDQSLKKDLKASARVVGEYVWELPMHGSYRELIKSKIADVKNVGGRPGGVITAAQFLEKFIHDVPWVHLDIAGPSYAEKESRPELPAGGTGWGVRLLLDYLMKQS